MAAVLVTVRPGALAQLPAGLLADLSARLPTTPLLRAVLLLAASLHRPARLAPGPSGLLTAVLLALRPALLLTAMLS